MTRQGDLYFHYFDYLRLFLSIVVVAHHAGLTDWQEAGTLAVQVFFALSGFLIGGILIRLPNSELPRFYFNRACRIWAPYFVALFLLITVSLLMDTLSAKWLEIVSYKLTFVYNFFGPPQLAEYYNQMPLSGTGNHFWSISAEEQFYLVAPLLILFLPASIGRSPIFWAAVAVLVSLTSARGFFTGISLGVLAAISVERYGKWYLSTWAMAAFCILAIVSGGILLKDATAYIAVAPLFSISAVMLLARPGPATKLGEFLGGISYPLYLNHWIGLTVANEVFQYVGAPLSLASKLTGVLFALMISTLLYLAVDRVVRRHRQRLFTVARGRFLAIMAYALVVTGAAVGLTMA